jgi:hypothetical protein
MERLKHLKEGLMCCVENQINHLDTVDTKELGEAIDMIKDLEEAMYYKTITEAMHEKDWRGEENGNRAYYPTMYYRDMDRDNGRMYYEDPKYMRRMYSESRGTHASGDGMVQYPDHDSRDGRSYRSRRMYMEHKEKHSDKQIQMKELENYMQELTQDVVEMVEGASQEERQYLSKRVAALANKLAQIND